MTADFRTGRKLRFEISSISGRTVDIQCSAAEETSWVLRSAAESLGFPWMGVGAYSLLVQNKLLNVHGKIIDCPDMLAAGDVIVATLVRRVGLNLEVVHPSFTLTGAPSSNRANFTAATICGLRQDMQTTLGMDFSDCQAVIAGVDFVVDEEADLVTMAVDGRPVEKISFVGHVKTDRRLAPSVRWVLRELPGGERYYEADFQVNTSAKEKSLDCSGYDSSSSTHVPSQGSGSSSSGESSVNHHEGKGKGKSKGVAPPLPTKGKGKGKGMGTPTRRDAIRAEKHDVTSLLTLVPGKRVLTSLRFTDEIGRDGKEGVVIGWWPDEGAWIVRMLNGMDWLLKTEHLLVRGDHGGWKMARAPADENSGAVDHFDPEARTVVRASIEEDCQARKWQSVVAHEDSRRKTVEWAQQCALDREIRIQALLTEGKREEICIGSVCPEAGGKPADAKWDPSILMTYRPCMVGKIQVSPLLQDVVFCF